MALKLIRKPLEVLTGTTGTGPGLLTVTGSWGIYFIAPNNGVAHVAVTGDVEQICVWVRDTDGLNIQTFRARRGAESMEQCALNVMVPLTKGQRWFVQAEGQGKTVTIMHDFKPIPPPCVIASFWGGGRCGVKEDRDGAASFRHWLGRNQKRRVCDDLVQRGTAGFGGDTTGGVATADDGAQRGDFQQPGRSSGGAYRHERGHAVYPLLAHRVRPNLLPRLNQRGGGVA